MEYGLLVDVKKYKCFPTVIGEFKYKIPSVCEELIRFKSSDIFSQTEDDIHLLSEFKSFKDTVLTATDKYLKDLEYIYDSLEITGMWANAMHGGETHPPHTHSNNLMSGVYYLKASKDTAPIQFFDPRAQAHILTPRKKYNWDNSNMIQFNSVKGVGLLFPSWLQHWVPHNKDDRISISWNIIARGDYGEPKSLQNANI